MLVLKKKPKNPIIIEGFPGFGLIGTIATEFLTEHLSTEAIGKLWFEEMPAMVAMHKGKLVEPIGIFYDSKYNIIIIHAIMATSGIEWKVADAIIDIAKQTDAKEIISLEGVGSPAMKEEPRSFFYSSDEGKRKKLKELGLTQLDEGIIMGVTSSLLLKSHFTTTALFAETHSELPDSKAAAKVIEALDKYLGLKVDYKPLLETAVKFEDKIKTLMEQGQSAQEQKDKKAMSYVG